jgi:hypothetical protein
MSQKQPRPDATNVEAPGTTELSQIMSQLPASRKEPVAALLRAILALVESTPEAEPADELVPVTSAGLAPYMLGPTPVLAAIESGELRAVQGSRRRRCVYRSEVVRWRDSRPVAPRPPRKSRPTGVNVDPIDQMIAAGELVARGNQ